jgi:paraquat-inducible protein A
MTARMLVVCEHCDTVHRRTERPGSIARCRRCGAELYRDRRLSLDLTLALALAGLIVLAIANAFPIVSLEARGVRSEATLWQTILASYDSRIGPLAVVAAATVFFFPLLQFTLLIYVLWPLRHGRVPRALSGAMHALHQMRPWSMVEVFMIGALVSAVKLGGVAQVEPRVGLFGFAALTVLLTAAVSFDARDVWNRAEELQA